MNIATRNHRGLAGPSGQGGFTLIEVLVAALVLIVGMLATFAAISSGNFNLTKTRAREGATNLARELLENSHDISYTQVGQPNSFTPTLQNLPGRTGAVTGAGSSQQTTATRRGVNYTVTVTWCAVDDLGDGYGAHTTGLSWCYDSGSTGTQDAQPEDFKRVVTTINYSFGGVAQPSVQQAATFSASGVTIGPTVTALSITSPTGLSPTAPVINNSGTTTVTFLASSLGATNILFSVNGVEQSTGVINNGDGTWSFNWNIAPLKDAVYTIGAVAVDSAGTRGQPRTLDVRLARGTPIVPQNVTGGYNDVWVSGTKTLAVELAWNANPEGNVIGYEVDKGATVVCSASLATSCIDFSPASSGTTTYTVKTLYINGAGNQAWVSTNYDVPFPAFPTRYGFRSGTTATSGCSPAVSGGAVTDLVSNFPTSGGTTASTNVFSPGITGCIPLLPAGVSMVSGTATFTGWFGNPTTKTCNIDYALLLNNSTLLVSSISSGSTRFSIPPNTTAAQFTATFTPGAQTFNAGDRLSFYVQGSNGAGNCGSTVLYYNSGTYQSTVDLPLSGPATLRQPGAPAGLSVTVNTDGTRTLSWTAPTGTPAVEFYRIYRDGQNYTNRVDTSGATGSTVTWTDTAAGGTSHTYRVTAVSATLTESGFAGPVSG
jgi:type II secretory pathway pseudopilin PulG